MKSLEILDQGLDNIPAITAYYLADIAEAKGRQYLYTNQSPQTLKVLREHALVESAVSSNRIEGVEIDRKRIGTVIFGKSILSDRDEEEISGYRNALEWIHQKSNAIQITNTNIKRIHTLCRGEIWDAGKFKKKDSDIIERLSNGEIRVRFNTVKASQTFENMILLNNYYKDLLRDKKVHPLILIGAYSLDFLCIHPFRDGNGRVSRLLLLLMLYQNNFEVGRYISIEKLIEENKERYYETLEMSSINWHKGKHDIWPIINFLLYIIKKSYGHFSDRFEKHTPKRGVKTDIIIQKISEFKDSFSFSELLAICPDISADMIRNVLQKLRAEKTISLRGHGVSARWTYIG